MKYLKVVTLLAVMIAFGALSVYAKTASNHNNKGAVVQGMKKAPGSLPLKKISPSDLADEKRDITKLQAKAQFVKTAHLKKQAHLYKTSSLNEARYKTMSLSGAYTVGVGGDFATLNDMAALLSLAKIGGPTTFLLTDSAYNETGFEIGAYKNGSATNLVTLRPDTGVTAVNITLTDNQDIGGGIVFSGSSWFTIEGVAAGDTVARTSVMSIAFDMSGGDGSFPVNDWDAPVEVTGASSHISVNDVSLQGWTKSDVSDATPNVCVINYTQFQPYDSATLASISDAGQNSHVSFNNCTMVNGMYGVLDIGDVDNYYLFYANDNGSPADSDSFDNNIYVTNCSISGAQQYGIHLLGVSSAYIGNNHVFNCTNNWGPGGPDGLRQGGISIVGMHSTIINNVVDNILQPYVTSSSAGRTYGIRVQGPAAISPAINAGSNTGVNFYNGEVYYANVTPNNTVANNVITRVFSNAHPGGGLSSFGLEIQGDFGTHVYYNSIYMSGTGYGNSGSSCINVQGYLYVTTNVDGINNALSNDRNDAGHLDCAMRSYDYGDAYGGHDWGKTSDNNVWNAPAVYGTSGGVVGFATLPAFYANYGAKSDLNSVMTSPKFTSATNLTPTSGSSVFGLGAPVFIKTDMNGATRDAHHPNAGAFETAASGTAPIDVTMLSNDITGGIINLPVTFKGTVFNGSNVAATAIAVSITVYDNTMTQVAAGTATIASLGAYASQQVTFTPNWTPTIVGTYSAVLVANTTGDAILSNDTLTSAISVGSTIGYPYHTSFETAPDQLGWTLTGDFAFGSVSGLNGPQSTKLGGAHSGDVYAVTVPGAPNDGVEGDPGNATYNTATISYLYTPFFDFRGMTKGVIGFYHSIKTEPGWDKSIFQYSLDAGNTWKTLGVLNDPHGINWYSTSVYQNAAGVASEFDPSTATTLGFPSDNPGVVPPAAWSSNGDGVNETYNGTDNNEIITDVTGPFGYIYVQYDLSALTGANSPFGKNGVRFRYTSWADAAGVQDGWAVDDFSLDTVGLQSLPAVFSGQVVTDINGNGVLDGGDNVGVSGISVNLLYFGAPSAQTATTDGSGNFADTMKLPGTYAAAVVSSTLYQSVSGGSVIYAGDGTASTGHIVGVYQGYIAGTKYNDVNDNHTMDGGDVGFAGWTIEVHSDSLAGALVTKAVTPSNGVYSLPVVPGNYYVKEVAQTGYRRTEPLSGSYHLVVSGNSGAGTADYSGNNFGDFQLARLQVYFNNDLNGDGKRNPVNDVSQLPFFGYITYQKVGDTTTIQKDTMGYSNKSISFANLDTGTYTVQWKDSTYAGWTRTSPGFHTLVVNHSSIFDTCPFLAFQHYGIKAYVYNDLNGNGFFDIGEPTVPGVVVSLAGHGSDTTDGTGKFTFSNIDTGSYAMTVAPGAGKFATQGSAGAVVRQLSGVTDTLDWFGLFTTYSVSGQVYNDYNDDSVLSAGETGASGQLVILHRTSGKSDTATTDSHGSYSFAGVDTGSWHLSFNTRSGDVATQGAAGYSFTGTSGGTQSGKLFGQYRVADTTKYYTLTAADLVAGSSVKAEGIKKGVGQGSGPNITDAMNQLLTTAGSVQLGVAGINFPGTTTPQAYIVPKKAKDLYASFFAKMLTQTGTPSGLDFSAKGKVIAKKAASIPPTEKNDVLIANQLALKVNLAMSGSITNGGLGALLINDGSAYAGWSVAAFAAHVDSIMTGWEFHTAAEYAAANTTAAAINNAFSGAFTPNGSWATGVVALAGSRSVTESLILLSPKAPAPTAHPISVKKVIPTTYALHQNYPNPFNPTTFISFDLPKTAVVTLKVYNMLGQEVTTLFDHASMSAGTQQVTFNANNYASGVYFYHLTATGAADAKGVSTFDEIKKMVLVK